MRIMPDDAHLAALSVVMLDKLPPIARSPEPIAPSARSAGGR
jgi:hypothetical protein